MKNILKRLSMLLLLVLLAQHLCVPALAASVTYEGGAEKFVFLPGSAYSDTDLFENFKNVMPGDTVEQRITVKNRFRGCDYVKIYLRADPHDEKKNPLSPEVSAAGETVASMKDFLSQLSMTVYQGDKILYQASPDVLDGLSKNVLLGRFSRGQSTELRVVLSVPAELGNSYAKRAGEVDWVFTAEQRNEDGSIPKTGDDTSVLLYAALLVIGIVGLLLPLWKRRKRK